MEYLLISWNVNGVRATQSQVEDLLKRFSPTILSLQETKAEKSQLDSAFRMQPGYNSYWVSSAVKKGYSGVANYVIDQLKPRNIVKSADLNEFDAFGDMFGADSGPSYDFDQEGRILSMEFDQFVLFNIYFPNGRSGERVDHKLEFYDHVLKECQKLFAQGKEVIICGDLNTAHHEIDLGEPEAHSNHTGFLNIEREWIDRYLDAGFVDTFRHLHPQEVNKFTYWPSVMVHADRNKIGWRIDYYLISKGLLPYLKEAEIHDLFMGSDHCPISIVLEF